MSNHRASDEISLPKTGDVIVGKYRIERLIGKGGMGAVYSAQHELLGQRVAIKFLLGEIVSNTEAVQRFLNEARNAAKLQSEHVCRVMDVGTAENGLPYMVLEFLEGLDLSQRLEQHGPLGVEEAVDYVLQALEAVAQAHQLGIVHRDLKPANLFLARRSDGSTAVKVLDFGIAKASNPFGESANHSLTSTKSMLGSPLYMSPEQLRSARNVDARADIWAMGVILYELLTGAAPFNGETLGELFIAILEQPPPPITQKRGDVPQALSDAIQRCLQRPVDQRFQNVAELAHAIASCAPARRFVSVERITMTLGANSLSNVQTASSSGNFKAQSQSGAGYTQVFHQSGQQISTGGHRQRQPSIGDASWGGTAGDTPHKSKAPLFIGLGVAAFLMLAGLGGFGVYSASHHAPAGAGGGLVVSTSAGPKAETTPQPAAVTTVEPAKSAASASPLPALDTTRAPPRTPVVQAQPPKYNSVSAGTTVVTKSPPPPLETKPKPKSVDIYAP